jgi:hypothetical protein
MPLGNKATTHAINWYRHIVTHVPGHDDNPHTRSTDRDTNARPLIAQTNDDRASLIEQTATSLQFIKANPNRTYTTDDNINPRPHHDLLHLNLRI